MRPLLQPSLLLVASLLVACSTVQRTYSSGAGGSDGGAGGEGKSSTTSTETGAGGAGGEGGGTVNPAEICAKYGSTVCSGYQKCAPDTVTAQFGDMARCSERQALFCSLVLEAPNTSWTPTQMNACLGALGELTCPDFLLAPFTGGPGPCLPQPGKLPNGSACVDAGQCESAYCKRSGLVPCGTCGPRSATGEACSSIFDCQLGLACNGGTCAKAAQAGQACSLGQIECALGLACQNGTCKPGIEENASCSASGAVCDWLESLYCRQPEKVCTRATYAGPGASCGIVNNTLVNCSGAGLCNVAKSCVAPAKDGAACNPKAGTGCMLPAVCYNGVCTLARQSACN